MFALWQSFILLDDHYLFCFFSIPSTLDTENHDPKDHSWDKIDREKTDLSKNGWEGG